MNTGIIGIGLMGRAFVERFQSQGFSIRVFNRTPDSVKDFEASGAVVCDSVDELISASDTIEVSSFKVRVINATSDYIRFRVLSD